MSELGARVRGCLAALHDMTGIDDGADLIATLGLDSLDIVEIEAELSFAIGVEVDLVEAFREGPASVQGLTELVASAQGGDVTWR